MHMRQKLLLACACVLSIGGAAAADEVFSPVAAISIPPGGVSSFDISFVDPAIGTYVLADRTNKTVDVIDTATNTLAAQLGLGTFVGFTGNNDTSGPDGVFIVDHRQVWAGDGDSTIKVFDLQTQALITTINTGGAFRADEGCVDPHRHLVMMANDAEHDNPAKWPFVTIISTDTFAVLHTITMDGTNGAPLATNGIEQCQWNPHNGKFYLNIPENNGPAAGAPAGAVDSAPGVVLVISAEGKIEKTFTIDHNKCAGPQGMALGPDGQILLGCNARSGNGQNSTVVIDDDGHIVTTLANESGSDEVWFNPGDGHYLLARSTVNANASDAATGNSMLGVVDAESLHEDASVTTGTVGFKAHSVAADPVLNQVYVPIPKNSGALTSTICSAAGGDDTIGCIAVFTAPNDDHSCLAEGAPVTKVEGGDSIFFKKPCGHHHR
jgi:hypothetical protein